MVEPPSAAALAWRPQTFGSRSARDIEDPLIEPLWSGIRVLAYVGSGRVTLRGLTGEGTASRTVEATLPGAVRAEQAVIDGYLTTDAVGSGEGVRTGPGVDPPTAGDMTRQMLLGGGTPSAVRTRQRAVTLEEAAARQVALDDDVVFVGVDLLALDGDELLDVPLLERKRLLDSVLDEDERVRRGLYVKPPVDPWITTWRAIGIRGLAYKAANSRYRPGEPNDAWATAAMPRG